MSWTIKATTKKNGNKSSVQQSIVDIRKIEKSSAAFLVPGEYFFQVFGTIVTRRLRFSPDEFAKPERYKRELDAIGVWIEKKKKVTLTKKRYTNGSFNI